MDCLELAGCIHWSELTDSYFYLEAKILNDALPHKLPSTLEFSRSKSLRSHRQKWAHGELTLLRGELHVLVGTVPRLWPYESGLSHL